MLGGNSTCSSRAARRSGRPGGSRPRRRSRSTRARELAERLEEAAHAHRFDKLVLVAAPKTLGDLRELLPDPVKTKVVAEIDKDLTKVPLRDLPRHLEAVLKL